MNQEPMIEMYDPETGKTIKVPATDIGAYKSIARKYEPPGYCVECHKPLDGDEIICGPCQDECDGRWDHLRQIKDEIE